MKTYINLQASALPPISSRNGEAGGVGGMGGMTWIFMEFEKRISRIWRGPGWADGTSFPRLYATACSPDPLRLFGLTEEWEEWAEWVRGGGVGDASPSFQSTACPQETLRFFGLTKELQEWGEWEEQRGFV